MKRIYSSVTRIYLGIIWDPGKRWCSENRAGEWMLHANEQDAIARLERQPEHTERKSKGATGWWVPTRDTAA